MRLGINCFINLATYDTEPLNPEMSKLDGSLRSGSVTPFTHERKENSLFNMRQMGTFSELSVVASLLRFYEYQILLRPGAFVRQLPPHQHAHFIPYTHTHRKPEATFSSL